MSVDGDSLCITDLNSIITKHNDHVKNKYWVTSQIIFEVTHLVGLIGWLYICIYI